MRYDEIFAKPIEEYTDEEIKQRALELRADAKLTKGKRKASTKTSSELTPKKGNKDSIGNMLEQAMKTAKTRQDGETDEDK